MNLIEPVPVASFGAGVAAAAGTLVGMSALWLAPSAALGAVVAVLVASKASSGPTVGSRRASAVVATLVVLALAGMVAALRLPARGSLGLLGWELARVTVLLLAGGGGAALTVLGLERGATAVRRRGGRTR